MNQLTHAIYVSSAKKAMSQEELVELLTISREANLKHNITGMLLYHKANFMQVIEGPKNAIEQLLLNIQKDERHTGMIVILKEEISNRSFGEWTMAFRHFTDDQTEGFSEFLNFNPKKEEGKILPGKAKTLLMGFRDSHT